MTCITVEDSESSVDVLPSAATVTIEAISGANVLIEPDCGSPVELSVTTSKITVTTPPTITIETVSGASIQIQGTIVEQSSGECFKDPPDEFANDLAHFWFGWISYEGGWLIERQLRSDSSQQYATVANNPTLTTFVDAWDDRVNLTYE